MGNPADHLQRSETKMNFDSKTFVDDIMQRSASAHSETPPEPIQWADMASWDNVPVPQREWLIRDIIPIRQPTLLSGEGAVGKSLITLHLLACTALTRPWIGLPPEQAGGAWYLGAEDNESELHIRLDAIRHHFGVSYADLVNGGFRLKSLFSEDAVLGAPSRHGIIEPTSLYRRLLEEASDVKPKCIALDASADVFAGDEINRSQTRQFVGLLRKLAGAADGGVVLLSHPSLTGINTGTGLSGSTAWHNSVRARMYLTSPKPESGEQPDSDLRELTFKKNNYGAKPSSIILRYQNGLFLPEKSMTSLDRAAHDMNADTAYLAGLRKLVSQGQTASPQMQSPYYAPRTIAKVTKGFRLAELEAAQQRLLDTQRIHIRDEGKPSRPVYRLYPGAPNEGGQVGGGGTHAHHHASH
jgi:RecA-family ATPase